MNRSVKVFALLAVAGALVAGSAQAQTTATGGSMVLTGVNGSSGYGYYTNPYFMKFSFPTLQANAAYLPLYGVGGFTAPAVDVFCVDYFDNINFNQVYTPINFTNLGLNPGAVGTYTRNASITLYLAAAYEANKILTTDYANRSFRTGVMWYLLDGGTAPVDLAIQTEALNALVNAGTVDPYQWTVVTDAAAAGHPSNPRTADQYGTQEFLTHVTAEPATLLLLGTGLLGMLVAAGALRRSVV